MNPATIVSAVERSLASTLSTLVGGEVTCALASSEQAAPPTESDMLVLTASASEPVALVLLENAWGEYLSAALESAGDKTQDPVRLAAAVSKRFYGGLQKAMDGLGVSLPQLTIRTDDALASTPWDAWTEPSAWDITVAVSGTSLTGWILFDVRPFAGAMKQESVEVPPAAAKASLPVPDLGAEKMTNVDAAGNLALLAGVEVEVTVELGRRRLALNDLLHLTRGSVIELEKLVGEPLEVYANGRLIADGEAVVIDEQFGIRITNLVAQAVQQRTAA